MRSIILFVVFLFATSTSFSQVEIKLEDLSKHVGDSVKVCGKVAGIHFLDNREGQPTFINMGKAYPNQLLTVVIWGQVRTTFEKAPEELFKDKDICIIGKVELYKEKPQIVIFEKKQILIQ